jgi:hypothetical protein
MLPENKEGERESSESGVGEYPPQFVTTDMVGRCIFWIGDSCIKRCEQAPEWQALSGRGLHSENAGRNGESSAQLLDRARLLINEKTELEPAAFVVCVGANDLMIDTPEVICDNICEVLATLRSAFPSAVLFFIELASSSAGCTCSFRKHSASNRKLSKCGARRCGRDRCNSCKVALTVKGVNQVLRQTLNVTSGSEMEIADAGGVRLIPQPGAANQCPLTLAVRCLAAQCPRQRPASYPVPASYH